MELFYISLALVSIRTHFTGGESSGSCQGESSGSSTEPHTRDSWIWMNEARWHDLNQAMAGAVM